MRLSNYILERKLRPNEYPHQIYVQNCCTANTTCLCLRKFVFSPIVENQILKYPLARDYLYREVNLFFLLILNNIYTRWAKSHFTP